MSHTKRDPVLYVEFEAITKHQREEAQRQRKNFFILIAGLSFLAAVFVIGWVCS